MYRKPGPYEVKPEWIQQALVVDGGLIAVGVVILQALLPTQSLDVPAAISILAFAIAIPLLGTIIVLNHSQATYRFASYPWYYNMAISLGQGSAFVGVVAAFWHLSWIASALLIVSGGFGLVVYVLYIRQLERDNQAAKTTKSP